MKATKAIFAAREINQLVIDPAVKGKGWKPWRLALVGWGSLVATVLSLKVKQCWAFKTLM